MYDGTTALQVVGESNYQDNLRDAKGEAIAVLLPEPDNPYDQNAVSVYINGRRGGYLSRDDAVVFAPRMTEMVARSGKAVALNAQVSAGPSGICGVVLFYDPADFGLPTPAQHVEHRLAEAVSNALTMLPDRPFARFSHLADRVAVVDTETTGVYNSDRVVEAAVVMMSLDGRVMDEWETLIDPCRDVGPTWIHGITSQMLIGAPTFDQIAAELAGRLNGALVCAHNLSFDARMLRNEYGRMDIAFELGRGLDTLGPSGVRLSVACEEHGIALTGAHCALHDARATAQLLTMLADRFSDPVPARFLTPLASPGPITVRTRAADRLSVAPPTYLAELVAKVVHRSDDVAMLAYLDVLDRAMADLHLDGNEEAELVALAADLGLDETDTRRAHLRWLDDMIAVARADGVVDGAEYDQLLRAALLLGIDADRVRSRTVSERSEAATTTVTRGMGVCFTGEATDADGRPMPRELLESRAEGLGLKAESSFTKSRCQLLVAMDATSLSGKAAKARKWGMPIISVAHFLTITSLPAEVPAVVTESGVRVAYQCEQCGAVHTAVTLNGRQPPCPVCGASPAKQAKTKSQPGPTS